MDTLLEGHFLFLLKDAQKLSVCCIPLDSNLQMCCSPYTATRQFGLNQPCSWLFKGFKACRSHAAEQTMLKLSAERLSQSLTRWRKTVPGRRHPLSSSLSTNSMELLYCEQHPGAEIICYGPRNLQSLLYMTHLQPNSPSYH